MKCSSIESANDIIFSHFAKRSQRSIRVATPLGLGKPNQLLNAIYKRVKADRTFRLDIFTALSLDLPDPASDIEGRFLGPFIERQWGKDYPRLAYLQDIKKKQLPPNINLHEFYVNAGTFKNNAYMQRHYLSMNYTHVAQSLADKRIELIVQLVAKRGDSYSLCSNSDLTLDVVDLLKKEDLAPFIVGVVHPDMPFLGGDAIVPESFFNLILDSPETSHKLFAVPRESISEVDSVIGLNASQLVEDGGTLQIGIGSLSDSLVNALLERQKDNKAYQEITKTFAADYFSEHENLHLGPFRHGLYGTSELVMDGFMHLREAGILTRTISDKGREIYLHAAFALGSSRFYAWLRNLSPEDFEGFSMTRVSNVNDLYDADENSLRRQRRKARFFNTCMQVTLLGAAASETLEDGTVISGVGGQYNFVAMAHELEKARSILMLRSTSVRDGRRVSNIVWSHGNSTIPRHLRDVVVTEYGVAFLRGKSDEDVIKELLNITDSEFQNELLGIAKLNNKIDLNYEVPESASHNNLSNIKKGLSRHPEFYKKFPFGSDFTDVELNIASALLSLKSQSTLKRLSAFIQGLLASKEDHKEEIERMAYDKDLGLKAKFMKTLFVGSLSTNLKKTPRKYSKV